MQHHDAGGHPALVPVLTAASSSALVVSPSSSASSSSAVDGHRNTLHFSCFGLCRASPLLASALRSRCSSATPPALPPLRAASPTAWHCLCSDLPSGTACSRHRTLAILVPVPPTPRLLHAAGLGAAALGIAPPLPPLPCARHRYCAPVRFSRRHPRPPPWLRPASSSPWPRSRSLPKLPDAGHPALCLSCCLPL
jgi:hypothetical protein